MFKSPSTHLFDRFRRLENEIPIGQKSFLFRRNSYRLGNNRSNSRKLCVKMTYRRALDASESGKPRGRYKILMPIRGSD